MSWSELPDREEKAGFIGFGVYEEGFSNHQLETLKRESVQGFLSLYTDDGRDGSRVYASKGNLLQLSGLIKEHQFGIDDFLDLSRQLLEIADAGENYLLNRDCIILNEQYILFDKERNASVFLLPIKNTKHTFSEEYQGFLKQLLLSTEIIGGNRNITDYKELFHQLQNREFCEKKYGRFIEELIMDRKLNRVVTEAEKENLDSFYEKEAGNKKEKTIDRSEYTRPTGITEKRNKIADGKEKLREIRRMVESKKVLEGILLIGWIGYLGIVLILKLGLKEAAGGSLLFLLLLYLLKKSGCEKTEIVEMNDEEWAKSFTSNIEKMEAIKEEEKESFHINKNFAEEHVKEMQTFENPFHSTSFSDTILIEEMKSPYIVFLEDENGDFLDENTEKKHFIENGVFIGRNKELSNIYLPEQAVGKIHSEIWREGSKRFLKDLNSKNGTWLNGIRLEPEEALELKDGDIITFATRKCVYREI